MSKPTPQSQTARNKVQDILKLELYKTDPLLNLLLRLNLTPIKITVYILFFGLLWRIIIPLIFNMRFPPRIDLLTLSFFFMPIAWSFYISSSKQNSKIFTSIWNKKAIISLKENKNAFLSYILKIKAISSHWIWIIIASIGSVFISIIVFIQFWLGNPNSWIDPSKFLWYALLEIITYTLTQYIVILILIREILLNYCLVNLYKNVNIKVLIDDPDRAGGWGQIGNHSAYISTIIIAFVEWIIASAYFETAQAGLGVKIYLFLYLALLVLFAPIVFFIPIWTTHKAMHSYKRNLLQGVSEKINRAFDIINAGEIGSVNLLSTQKNLDRLRSHYKTISESVLVWPIPNYLFRNVGISWLLPVITALLSATLESWVKNLP